VIWFNLSYYIHDGPDYDLLGLRQLTSNNSREVTTYGGFPRKAPGVVVTPVDHTILHVRWNTPGKLQKFYVCRVELSYRLQPRAPQA
jgi:hypothetical protein